MDEQAEDRDVLVERAKELTRILQHVGDLARERRDVFLKLRNERGMTYAAIGELVDLSRQAVEAICKGRGITDTPK